MSDEVRKKYIRILGDLKKRREPIDEYVEVIEHIEDMHSILKQIEGIEYPDEPEAIDDSSLQSRRNDRIRGVRRSLELLLDEYEDEISDNF